MDTLIKTLRANKPETKPSEANARAAELDPAEFLAAAVRADRPRPSRAEAEAAAQRAGMRGKLVGWAKQSVPTALSRQVT